MQKLHFFGHLIAVGLIHLDSTGSRQLRCGAQLPDQLDLLPVHGTKVAFAAIVCLLAELEAQYSQARNDCPKPQVESAGASQSCVTV